MIKILGITFLVMIAPSLIVNVIRFNIFGIFLSVFAILLCILLIRIS